MYSICLFEYTYARENVEEEDERGTEEVVNSSEAFLWTFFRPPNSSTSATVSASSSNTSAPVADVIGTATFSTGSLNESNAILAVGTNISTNLNQTFNAPAPTMAPE
ncbi:unnamed protein product [Diamesa serratosioi]